LTADSAIFTTLRAKVMDIILAAEVADQNWLGRSSCIEPDFESV
jgi:hypothetical protein